jgi:luciferase family oxidoreductase group 1
VINVPLSVLDLSPVAAGTTVGQALAQTTELARRVEELGYRRFWVAEHHNMPAIASSAPAVLLAHLAAATSTIRVGSGGVMLPNHAPLVVAEQFGTLEALHPGRIDLGIGRAPGTDQLTALALRRTMEGLSGEKFPEELLDLIRLFAGDARARVTATPGAGDMPALWLL